MGKSHGSIRSRLPLCDSCYKLIVGDNFHTVSSNRTKAVFKYHNTPQDCANAGELEKDWYRKYDRTQKYKRVKTGLQGSDGYSWDTDDSLPLWLVGMDY
jgi:hypothetical protein